VIATQEVPAGEDVAFDHPHQATDHPTRMALLPLGYMSGLPRAASVAAQVWLNGARRPIAGLIDMDQCVVDAGSAQIAVGDDAVFFGAGEQGEPTAAEWAHWANTNAQQVLTGLGLRVPRRYLPDSASDLDAAPTASSAQHKPRVTILFGGPGTEPEHAVSYAAAASIVTHLDRNRYVVRLVRITPDGHWIPGPANLPEGQYDPRDLARLTSAARGFSHQPTDILRAADVVIPALHGPFGEAGAAGTLQALMDTLNVRYIGSGMAASALATDKDAAKRVVQTTGIPVAHWAILRRDKEGLSDEDRTRLGLPVIVKPARSAPGAGTTRVTNWNDLEAALTTARTWDDQILIEQEIAGPEINVAVLEHPDGRLEAGPAPYADLDAQITADLQRLAIEVFTALGCSGLAQISFLLRGGTDPVFNEINPLPEFAPTSTYPQTWQATGLPFGDLLDHLVETALAKTNLSRS